MSESVSGSMTSAKSGSTDIDERAGRVLGSLAQGRLAISSTTLVVLGVQILFISFLLSALGLRDS